MANSDKRMFCHSQNLNEKIMERYGWKARHGRAWVQVPGWFECHWEWNFFRRQEWLGFGLELATGDSEAIGGNIQLAWLGAFYWGFGTPRLRRWLERITSREDKPREIDVCSICGVGRRQHIFSHAVVPKTYWSTNGREIGVVMRYGGIQFNLWADPMEFHSNDPRWWTFTLSPQLLLGRMRHSPGIIFDQQHVLIPMPEGGYPAIITMREEVWKRTRWFAHRRRRAHVEMEVPIPFPGKGENSWDCAEDSCHSMVCGADTVLDGMMAVTRAVMRDRIRYGGHNWKPSEKKTA